MDLSLQGNKKKKNAKNKYIILDIPVRKPTKTKYTEIDFVDIRREHLKEAESSGEDERFHDREALEMVRRLEAKYNKKGKKKKRKFGIEDDFIDKSAGYDLEDDFIDDTEAYDELIPSTMDTIKGGFYVNRGKLEFKQKDADESDSGGEEDSDEEEDEPEKEGASKLKKDKKKGIAETDSDADRETATAVKDTKDGPKKNHVNEETSGSSAAASRPRMTGAPPSKRSYSEAQKSQSTAASNGNEVKRKRMMGMPPTIKKTSGAVDSGSSSKTADAATKPTHEESKKSTPPTTATVSATNPSSSTVEKTKTVTTTPPTVQKTALPSATSSAPPLPSSTASQKTSTSVKESAAPEAKQASANQPQNSTSPQKSSSADPTNSTVASAPLIKMMNSMSSTLSGLLAEFVTVMTQLQNSGKKRLQDPQVDLLIKIEDQCNQDNLSPKDRAQLLATIADGINVQKSTLKHRLQLRRNEKQTSSKNVEADDDDIQVLPSTAPSTSVSTPTKTTTTVDEKNEKSKKIQGTRMFVIGTVPHWSTTDIEAMNAMVVNLRSSGYMITDTDIEETYRWIIKKKATQTSALQKIVDTMKEEAKKKEFPSVPTTSASSSSSVSTVATSVASKPAQAQPAKQSTQRRSHLSLSDAVELSMKYTDMMLKTPKKTLDMTAVAKVMASNQDAAVKVSLLAAKSSDEAYEEKKKEAQKHGQATPQKNFIYTDKMISAMNSYLEHIYTTSISLKSSDMFNFLINSIESIYMQISTHVKKGMFFVDICRRLPKFALIIQVDKIKKLLDEEHIVLERVKVVQVPKYMIKLPEGEDSILKSTPAQKVSPVVAAKKSTTVPPLPASTSSAVDDDIQVIGGAQISTGGGQQVQASASAAALKSAEEMMKKLLLVMSDANTTPQNRKTCLVEYQKLHAIITVKAQEAANEMAKKKRDEDERLEKQKKLEEKQRQEKEKQRIAEEKLRQEKERQRIAEEKLRQEKEKQRIAEEKLRLAEEKKRKAEEERKEKEMLKAKQKEEERFRKLEEKEKREREIRERKEQEERARKEEESRKQHEIDLLRVKVETQLVEEQRAKERAQQMESIRAKKAKADEEEKKRIQKEQKPLHTSHQSSVPSSSSQQHLGATAQSASLKPKREVLSQEYEESVPIQQNTIPSQTSVHTNPHTVNQNSFPQSTQNNMGHFPQATPTSSLFSNQTVTTISYQPPMQPQQHHQPQPQPQPQQQHQHDPRVGFTQQLGQSPVRQPSTVQSPHLNQHSTSFGQSMRSPQSHHMPMQQQMSNSAMHHPVNSPSSVSNFASPTYNFSPQMQQHHQRQTTAFPYPQTDPRIVQPQPTSPQTMMNMAYHQQQQQQQQQKQQQLQHQQQQALQQQQTLQQQYQQNMHTQQQQMMMLQQQQRQQELLRQQQQLQQNQQTGNNLYQQHGNFNNRFGF